MSQHRENPIEFFNVPKEIQTDSLQQPKNLLISGIGFEEKPYAPESLNRMKDDFKTMNDRAKSELAEKERRTIRWRFSEDGKVDSNARIVEWDDGTFQLVIGEDVFDCSGLPVSDTFLYSTSKLNTEPLLFPKGELNQRWQLKYRGKIRELDDKTISISDK